MKKIKEKIMKNYHPILIQEFKKTFSIYFLGMLMNGVNIIFHVMIPIFIGNILDLLLQETIVEETIMRQIFYLLIVSIFMLIPRSIYRTLLFTRARISDTELRKQVVEQLQKVKPEYYDQEEKSAFLSYLSKELLMIRRFLGEFFFQLGKICLNPIVIISILAIQYNMTISIAIIPIVLIITISIFRHYKELEEKIEKGRLVDIELAKTIEQNTAGFSLVKLYNEQKNQVNKFKTINERRYETDYQIGVAKNKIANGINLMYGMCFCLVFGIGIWLVYHDSMTVGGLTAVITCTSLVVSEITSSIRPLIESIAYFKIASKRYNYFYQLEPYQTKGETIEEIKEIEIKDLTYAYEPNKEVLHQISMKIEKGQKIGIIGQVSSGKTTLMNILAGFLEIEDDQVLINGKDKNQYARNEIFTHIGYAPQKNIILDDTIQNNINIKQEEDFNIEKVANLSDLRKDIQEMKEGYQTKIGEQGSRLSGGQKQRVQIARTLSYIRDVNIYDDSLSALDHETEEKVLGHMIEETKGNTLIVVSNKVSSMEKMDQIYLLIDGKIEAQGTHEELLESNSFYHEMSQYEKEGDWI